MRNLLLSLLLLFLASPGIQAQKNLPVQTVRGVVTDKVSRVTLPGANVVLLNTDPLVGTVSDSQGRFRFDKVPVGRVSLKVSFMGYQDAVLQNLDLGAGRELVLEIELVEKVITKEVVVISATAGKSEAVNKMVSASSRGFTVEETERYAGSLNDVARMAANFAGVSGANDARNDIIIRGNSPAGLLWRLEGIDIPNPNHYGAISSTGGPVSMLNNTLLTNSDFMTGAFPAEYGNAVSGVFDLKMRNGNNERHEFLGQVGFNGFEAGAEGPVSKAKGSSYLVNYRYSTLELMENMGFDFGTGTGIPRYQDLSFKINLPGTSLGSFSLFGLGGLSDIEMWDSRRDTAENKLDLYGGEGYDLTNTSSMGVIGLNHIFSFDKSLYSRASLAASYHSFKVIMDSLVPVTLAKQPNYRNDMVETNFIINLVLNKKFSARSNARTGFSLTFPGFDLVDSTYEGSTGSFRTLTDYSGRSVLVQPYVQWQYKFSDLLVLNSGIHYTYFGLNGTQSLEPRLGVRWNLSPGKTLGLAYGLHSQLVPITLYFRQENLPGGGFVRMNEDLGMLKSHHLVASFDWNITEYLRLKPELYYQYLFDAGVDGNKASYFSVLNQGANFGFWSPDTLKNGGTGHNLGMELTLEHFLNKGLYYLFTASLFDSRYKGSDGVLRNTAFNGNYVFNLLLGREFVLGTKKLTTAGTRNTVAFDFKTTWAGGQRYIPSVAEYDAASGYYAWQFDESRAYTAKYRDYFRSDLKLTYRRNGRKITQEFSLNVENLFGQKNIYRENLNRKTGEKSYVYQTGRMVIPQYRIIF